ncbi:Carboxypeptidase [Meloidogyne graminicola]|uniref:Carboxypeptidase n=1 Tax=Meloidogyne graminicola TaxID=189291 RepID=A0A8T0A405_9BILA|nr:Carboxypeptidase [Meloidogyne graminicola]
MNQKILFYINFFILFFNFAKQQNTTNKPNLPFNNDEITDKLPGLDFELKFKHYSGYLQVSQTRFFHYMLVTSKVDPINDPLIFWFNGGPGCSSLLGLFTELGPYLINEDGTKLLENVYSWNNLASVVFMETPAGVGFSYSTDGNNTNNDNLVIVEEHYNAIKQFYKKYPNFRRNNVFITGESYAGIYLPMLTSNIIKRKNNYPINLKGLLIGNGLLNSKLAGATTFEFIYNHGAIEESYWVDFVKKCCNGNIDNCNVDTLTGICAKTAYDFYNIYSQSSVNVYNIYQYCDNSPNGNSSTGMTFFYTKIKENLAKRAGKYLTRHKRDESYNYDPSLIPCIPDATISNYLNNPEVLKALHIPSDKNLLWSACTSNLDYSMVQEDMTPFFNDILKAKISIVLYYGDTDSVCPFLHGQKFIEKLNLTLISPRNFWYFNNQVAGTRTLFKGLTYLTVSGVGHMVPQWAPERALFIANDTLNNMIY